ncbi:MAG: radical SAM protein [Acetatifactor sp.]|nr:radical SAM protein [Acetatifactor sp.]
MGEKLEVKLDVKRSIHVINELPHYYELQDMFDFCAKYENLYIYGTAYEQEMLLKYFDMSGIKIDGFVVTQGEEDEREFVYRQLPVRNIHDVMKEKGAGVILAISEKYFGSIIPMFRREGFTDYFRMSEYNKAAIAYNVRRRPKEEYTLEVNVSDHCNLSCQMCDHYSQLSKERFLDIEQFEKDMKRLGELFDHKIACITLLGGEPTLNKNLIKCIKVVRESFPDCQLIILTNGVLLLDWENYPEGNLWQACKDYKVDITVTVYPINLKYEEMERKAKEYGINLKMSSDIHAVTPTKMVKVSDKHVMKPDKSSPNYLGIGCLYYNKFNVLKNGRIYMCPVAAHSGILNESFGQNFELTDKDSIDIYKVNSWEEITEFGCHAIPFCSYCDLRNWHHDSNWKASSKTIDEYI